MDIYFTILQEIKDQPQRVLSRSYKIPDFQDYN